MKTRTVEPLLEHLQQYTPFNDLEALYVHQLQQFLQESSNAYDRTNLVAHVVADAWIVNPSRDKVVLVEHALNKVWMAPGGHCDGNPDVFAAAIREAEEETGLINLTPLNNGGIFDINTGNVPTRKRHGIIEPAHVHFDICYAFEAPHDENLAISNESTNLAWVPLSKISEINYRTEHLRRIEKTHKLLL